VNAPRKKTWRTDLLTYLHDVSRTTFVFGKFDCALFFAGAVNSMTGVDLLEGLSPQYTTLEGGLRFLRSIGYRDHIDYVEKNFPEIPPALAQVGDGVVVPTPEGPALGIMQGERVYVPRPIGFGTLPRSAAARTFRVG
jgi:hypothetical protein